MGFGASKPQVLDHQGNVVIDRKCMVFVCPPSFETSKFVEGKPEYLHYRYISVGKLIRDEINKRTHYSKIIMENLAAHKKINQKILEILLKNVALQGNFIIQFSPKDAEDLEIWRKFLAQVQVQLVVVIKPDHKAEVAQQKIIFEDKLKAYHKDIHDIEAIFKADQILTLEPDKNAWSVIAQKLNSKTNSEV